MYGDSDSVMDSVFTSMSQHHELKLPTTNIFWPPVVYLVVTCSVFPVRLLLCPSFMSRLLPYHMPPIMSPFFFTTLFFFSFHCFVFIPYPSLPVLLYGVFSSFFPHPYFFLSIFLYAVYRVLPLRVLLCVLSHERMLLSYPRLSMLSPRLPMSSVHLP